MIRVVKERYRAITITLSYLLLPKQMVIYLIYFVVLCLNSVPAAQGILEVHSPREIVTRRGLYFKKYFAHQFGDYVEANENAVITNTSHLCTHPGIYLDTTGNLQGTHKVFDLKTGKVKKPRTVTSFLVPDNVTSFVNQWGKCSKREATKNKFDFLNRSMQPYD